MTAVASRQQITRYYPASAMHRAERNMRKAAKMRHFSAFTTDGDCIKDGTLIDSTCGSSNFLTETYISLANYYVFRINYGEHYQTVRKEILEGRLRQGWGGEGMSICNTTAEDFRRIENFY